MEPHKEVYYTLTLVFSFNVMLINSLISGAVCITPCGIAPLTKLFVLRERTCTGEIKTH